MRDYFSAHVQCDICHKIYKLYDIIGMLMHSKLHPNVKWLEVRLKYGKKKIHLRNKYYD